MRERFIEIKKSVSKKIDDVLRSVLDMPPSYEEAYLNFKHAKNCSQSQDLATLTITRAVTPYDPSAPGMGRLSDVTVELKYLECPECHHSVRYSR